MYDYGYDYGYAAETANGLAGMLGVMGVLYIGIFIFSAVIGLIAIISYAKIFIKAGKPWWASIIPVYNFIVMIEIAKLPMWYIALFFVPIVNFYAIFKINIEIAKKFNKGIGFGIGMTLLSIIFIPLLAFSDDKYESDNFVSENDNNQFDAKNVINNNVSVDSSNSNVVAPIGIVPTGNFSIESASVNVEPTENIPIEPAPVNVELTENIPVEPAPVNVELTENIPFEPAPVNVESTENIPLEPASVNVEPIENIPLEPASVNVEPIENIPVEPIVNAFNIAPDVPMVNNVESADINETTISPLNTNVELTANEVEGEKNCKNCGNVLPDIVSICPNCGTDNE